MCGVLGITIADFNERDYGIIRSLFQQSMIRGKHATGVSYVKNGKVHTIKEPIPADEFIQKQNLETWRNEDGNLYCIGHIRYSTSDLRYNQPFATDELGIVHNGVISQEPSSTWRQLFGYETETANDSELVLRAMEKDENPLTVFHPASMAVCALFADKRLTAFRNHERPLYYYSDDRVTIFASTKDILKRSGIPSSEKTRMFEIYNVNNFKLSHFEVADDKWLKETFNIEDLQ
jgi:glutamine phosphoribosylpyrophosphate amidotransferase